MYATSAQKHTTVLQLVSCIYYSLTFHQLLLLSTIPQVSLEHKARVVRQVESFVSEAKNGTAGSMQWSTKKNLSSESTKSCNQNIIHSLYVTVTEKFINLLFGYVFRKYLTIVIWLWFERSDYVLAQRSGYLLLI